MTNNCIVHATNEEEYEKLDKKQKRPLKNYRERRKGLLERLSTMNHNYPHGIKENLYSVPYSAYINSTRVWRFLFEFVGLTFFIHVLYYVLASAKIVYRSFVVKFFMWLFTYFIGLLLALPHFFEWTHGMNPYIWKNVFEEYVDHYYTHGCNDEEFALTAFQKFELKRISIERNRVFIVAIVVILVLDIVLLVKWAPQSASQAWSDAWKEAEEQYKKNEARREYKEMLQREFAAADLRQHGEIVLDPDHLIQDQLYPEERAYSDAVTRIRVIDPKEFK